MVLQQLIERTPPANNREARPTEADERVRDGIVGTTVVAGQVPGTDPLRGRGTNLNGWIEGEIRAQERLQGHGLRSSVRSASMGSREDFWQGVVVDIPYSRAPVVPGSAPSATSELSVDIEPNRFAIEPSPAVSGMPPAARSWRAIDRYVAAIDNPIPVRNASYSDRHGSHRVLREAFVIITIEGASEEFERKLLALLAEHRDDLAVFADTAWDGDRAMVFLNTLNEDARQFVRLIVESDGHLDAAVLREAFPRGLRGPTVALTYALKRGYKHGWWPEGTEAPVTVIYGGGPQDGWRQASAYEMSGEDLLAFRAALAHYDAASSRPPWDEEAPSAFAVNAGWGADDDVPNALLDDPPTAPNFPDGATR
jgi:hypothetical protein